MTVDGLPDDWRSSHRARGGGSVRDIPRPYERGDRDQPVLVRADGGKPRFVVVAKVRSDQPSGPRPCRRPSRGRVSCRCDPIHFGARSHRVGRAPWVLGSMLGGLSGQCGPRVPSSSGRCSSASMPTGHPRRRPLAPILVRGIVGPRLAGTGWSTCLPDVRLRSCPAA